MIGTQDLVQNVEATAARCQPGAFREVGRELGKIAEEQPVNFNNAIRGLSCHRRLRTIAFPASVEPLRNLLVAARATPARPPSALRVSAITVARVAHDRHLT